MLQRNKPFFKVTCNTEHVGPGSTFVAISGFKTDGALFIPKAIGLGALSIVADEKSMLARDYESIFPHIPFSYVENPRKELALLSAQAYNNPASQLQLIGVTGTKGKTTTVFLIHHILKSVGYITALCSSIVNIVDNEEEESMHATIGSDALHFFLARCVEKKVTHVVVEVSSHALALYRVYGINFKAVAFTNCSPEHLDFHSNFEDYFSTKKKLFDQVSKGGSIVINTQTQSGNALFFQLKHEKKFHHVVAPESFEAPHLPAGWSDAFFMKENVSLAASVCKELGVSHDAIQKALTSFKGVPGRMQFHTLKNGALGVVDHAHEPLSFEIMLSFLKKKCSQLIVVFGCGGDRTYKRPLLGAIAARYADVVILTNDNPRFDDPSSIIHNILEGVSLEHRSKIVIELNRANALERAVALSTSQSCVALLGKGHEHYQIEGEKKFYWNDFEALLNY